MVDVVEDKKIHEVSINDNSQSLPGDFSIVEINDVQHKIANPKPVGLRSGENKPQMRIKRSVQENQQIEEDNSDKDINFSKLRRDSLEEETQTRKILGSRGEDTLSDIQVFKNEVGIPTIKDKVK